MRFSWILFAVICCPAVGRKEVVAAAAAAEGTDCAEAGEKAKDCNAKGKQTASECCYNAVCGTQNRCVLKNGSPIGDSPTSAAPATDPSACPIQTLKVRCVTWVVTSNGNGLHCMASVMDENDDAVIGVDVTMDTTDPMGDVSEFQSTTTGNAWVNYRDALDDNCEGVHDGVTSDKCYQKPLDGTYSGRVTKMVLEGCPDVAVDCGDAGTYTFPPG